MEKGSKKTDLPPHPRPADYEEFMLACTPIERELHAMGVELLGSSYFVDRTRSYKKWSAAKKTTTK